MRQKICVLSEGLGGTQDEGMRNFVFALSEALGREHDVRAIGLDTGARTPGGVKTNRLLLSRKLRRTIAQHSPDVVLYVPLASSTVGSYLRSWVLGRLYSRAPVVMLALQPRRHGSLDYKIMQRFHPDALLAQDSSSISDGPDNIPKGTLPSGVDTDRFKPVRPQERLWLRRSIGLEEPDFAVLHVGHIRRQRNVAFMSALCEEPSCRPILIGSTSTEQDDDLAAELEQAGAMVIRKRIPDIEHYYQAADCYLFPVNSDQAAMEMPLSVLEAMATNLPVLSTRFGALPIHFPEGGGIWYFDEVTEIPALLENVRRKIIVSTREQIMPFSWDQIAARLTETLEKWGMLPGGGAS
ncbi:MAG: glycosyltransferase family 4 protein [Candidatus Eisenbacteria sp.]|nr:glycosyltransferase family 4 protein [Candidatus Eisenbacteria bacterium]